MDNVVPYLTQALIQVCKQQPKEHALFLVYILHIYILYTILYIL